MARLQEELKALKVREGEAVASARELKLQLQELSDTWQVRAPARRTRRGPCGPRGWRPSAHLSPQAHLSRGGRWKESPRKLVLGELQDELMSVRLREAQALAEGRELRQRVVELETQVDPSARARGERCGRPAQWQGRDPCPPARPQDHIHRNLLNRVEAERAALQEKLQYLAAQNKGLQTQLSESRRKQAEAECKVRPRPPPRPGPRPAAPLDPPSPPLPPEQGGGDGRAPAGGGQHGGGGRDAAAHRRAGDPGERRCRGGGLAPGRARP